MKNVGTPYKQLLSGLFLALYLFITLPVQYWHHHSVSTYTIEKGGSFSSITAPTDDTDFGFDCTICSHQYAVYCLDIEPVIQSPFESKVSYNDAYTPSLVCQIRDGLSNKGPPAII